MQKHIVAFALVGCLVLCYVLPLRSASLNQLPSASGTANVNSNHGAGTSTNLEVIHSGELNEWEPILIPPERRTATNIEYRNGYLYVIGGLVFSDTPPKYQPIDELSQTVIRARVAPDGSLVEWQEQAPMAVRRTDQGQVTAIVSDTLYAIAGYDPLTGTISTTEMAHINADGSLSSWQPSISLSTPRSLHVVEAYQNFIYVIGGVGSEVSDIKASVEMAVVSPDGSITEWQLVASLTEPRTGHAVVLAENYLYVFGGLDRFWRDLHSIERARINEDGTLDPWQVIGSLPLDRRPFYVGQAIQGFLYIMDYAGYSENNVQFAQFTSDGLLSQWQIAPSHGLRSAASATVIEERIYLMGNSGLGDVNEYVSAIQTTTIKKVQPDYSFLPYIP